MLYTTDPKIIDLLPYLAVSAFLQEDTAGNLRPLSDIQLLLAKPDTQLVALIFVATCKCDFERSFRLNKAALAFALEHLRNTERFAFSQSHPSTELSHA